MAEAARQMEKGDRQGALKTYRQALELAQADPSLRSLAHEIELTVQDVEKRVAAQASRPQPAIPPLPVGEGAGVRAEPRRKAGWGFWLLWVLASTAGWAVGDAVGWAVGGAAFGAAVGAVTGVAQWLLLRRQVRRAGWWILASTAGWAVGLAVGDAVGLAVVDAVGGAMGFAVGLAVGRAVGGAAVGAVTGVAQWLLLRRQVRRAGWWILASAAGLAVGLAVGLDVVLDVGNAVGGAVVGAVIGILTGAALVWLLRQSRPETKGDAQ
jgi:hypothetical protein